MATEDGKSDEGDQPPPIPTDRALVQVALARTPTDIRKGEHVLLDKRGTVVGRRRFKRAVGVWGVLIWGALLSGGGLYIAGFKLVGALVYLAGTSPSLYFNNYRGGARFRRIETLARLGHLEEAQRRLDDIKHLHRRNPVRFETIAGHLASHRGEHAEALRWWRQARDRMKPGLQLELLNVASVSALALSGDDTEARRLRANLQLPSGADQVLCGVILTDLVIALTSERLPSVEQLHDWASIVLAYSHTAIEVAAIGWAFEKHGDAGMARFMATEAPDRVHYAYLKTWWPALDEWLAQKASVDE